MSITTAIFVSFRENRSNAHKAYFRKAGYVCGLSKKGYILVNFGQF